MTALFFLDNITGATLRMMTPLLLVALGELYSERAGLTNIGLDGIMSIGTIAGFLGGCLTGSPWMGLLLGALCGVALNMIYAFCTITLRAGQIINGMALNILGPATLFRRDGYAHLRQPDAEYPHSLALGHSHPGRAVLRHPDDLSEPAASAWHLVLLL